MQTIHISVHFHILIENGAFSLRYQNQMQQNSIAFLSVFPYLLFALLHTRIKNKKLNKKGTLYAHTIHIFLITHSENYYFKILSLESPPSTAQTRTLYKEYAQLLSNKSRFFLCLLVCNNNKNIFYVIWFLAFSGIVFNIS